MTESKHVLTSKIFLTGLVTVLSGLAMIIADHYGVSLDISLTMQGGIVTVLGGLVAYWRKRPTKALHVKKSKELNTPSGPSYYYDFTKPMDSKEIEQLWLKNKGANIIATDREAMKNEANK